MEKQRFIFDIDGTLLVPDYSYERDYFKSALSNDDAAHFIPMIGKLLSEYENSQKRYDVDTLSDYLSRKSEIDISPSIVVGWKEAFQECESIVIDGVIETLEDLKRKDKSLVILTNWFLDVQTKRLEECGIRDYFDEIYGGEMAIKPNKMSYMMACGKYPVEEAVMIGDSLQYDVYGAMDTGLDAIYYNPKKTDNFDKNKVKSIGSLKEIRRMY